MKTLFALFAVLALPLAGARAGAPAVKEWEMILDPTPVSGKQTLTVRMTPSETIVYDQFVFDCTLRQEYMQESASGALRKRVVEPAVFTYREDNVKFVRDLDKHVSFWVPTGLAEVQLAFGETAFVTNAPVTISKVKVSAKLKGETVWTFESPPSGLHKPEAAAAAPAKKTAGAARP